MCRPTDDAVRYNCKDEFGRFANSEDAHNDNLD